MINRSFLAFSLYGKRVALKQQFTVYLNWFSFAPKTWKQGTLKNLVYRTYNICSTEYLLRKELLHLEKMLIYKNITPVGL